MQNIINIVLILAVMYIIFRLPSIEKMSNVDKATEDKIREIYKIDTDAIRNLSNLAKDLTVNGSLIVPGGLKIKGSLSVDEDIHMKGGKSIKSDGRLHINPQERLYLLAKEDTYITKDWNSSGNVKISGFTEQLGGGSVEGKLYYRHQGANGSDDSDPYFIEKVKTSDNNNHLRLTINDDPEESFQIWGNSCGSTGGCGGQGKELFKLDGNGNLSILNSGTFGNAYVGSWPSGNRYAVFTHKNRKGLDYALLQGDYGTTYLNSNDRIYIRKNNNSLQGKLNLSLLQPANTLPWSGGSWGNKMLENGANEGDIMLVNRQGDPMGTLTTLLNGRRIGWKGIWSGHEGGHGF
jgi:hypothetical protein